MVTVSEFHAVANAAASTVRDKKFCYLCFRSERVVLLLNCPEGCLVNAVFSIKRNSRVVNSGMQAHEIVPHRWHPDKRAISNHGITPLSQIRLKRGALRAAVPEHFAYFDLVLRAVRRHHFGQGEVVNTFHGFARLGSGRQRETSQ